MDSIRNTVTEALDPSVVRSYGRYVEQVVEALEGREEQITDDLADFAYGKGLSENEVHDLFVQVGLAEVADPDNQGDLATVLAAIESLRQEVSAIKTAAARHGVRV